MQGGRGCHIAQIAANHGLEPNLVYAWRNAEKAIRKAAGKEKKQAPSIADTNGASNGAKHSTAPVADKEPTQGLKITGLTPLIRELVVIELREQLPAIVAGEIQKAFARKSG